MKLGFSLINYVEFEGRKYRIDVSFVNVMRVTALVRDEGISERARVNAGLRGLLMYTDREVSSTSILQMRSTRLQYGFNSILK
jgi:hypothetical protein